jgi:hypothetical protein
VEVQNDSAAVARLDSSGKMEPEKPATPQQQILVMWVIWAAFLVGVCVQYHFLHAKNPPAADGSMTWVAAMAPVAVSMILRWNVLPRVKLPQSAMALMIVGVVLAESAAMIGMFVFPAHQLELFGAAFLGILQHAPIYMARLLGPSTQE